MCHIDETGKIKLFIEAAWVSAIQAKYPLGLVLQYGFIPIPPSKRAGDEIYTLEMNV